MPLSVTTLAGNAPPGVAPGSTNGVGTDARFNNPQSIAIDNFGNGFISNGGSSIISRIALGSATVAYVAGGGAGGAAGTGTACGFTDGTGSDALFCTPVGLAVSATLSDASAGVTDAVYVADASNNAIRLLTPLGSEFSVSTVAGNGPTSAGFVDGLGTTARFFQPHGVALNGLRTALYVGDSNNNVIRAINVGMTPPFLVTTLAGGGAAGGTADGFADGVGVSARVHRPIGVAWGQGSGLPYGAVYVADSTNNAIRAIPLSDATAAAVFATVTVAGNTSANPPALRDGPPLTAQFSTPTGVFYFERAGGKALGVADTDNNAVRGVLLTGFGLNASEVVTIAGGGRAGGYINAVGTNAMFFYPANLGVSSCGDFLVADDKNNAIRAVCPPA